MKIDARSDKIALHYTGSDAGEPAISGVPARDLTENDIDRLLYVRRTEAEGGTPEPIHGAARQASIDSIVDELTAGPYRITAPPSETKPAAAPPPPAEPSADQPKEA